MKRPRNAWGAGAGASFSAPRAACAAARDAARHARSRRSPSALGARRFSALTGLRMGSILGKFGHIIGARAVPRRGARLAEKGSRETARMGADLLGRSLRDDASSLCATGRTELDDPVGRGEELEVVLD